MIAQVQANSNGATREYILLRPAFVHGYMGFLDFDPETIGRTWEEQRII